MTASPRFQQRPVLGRARSLAIPALVSLVGPGAGAQSTLPRVVTGWGVDTIPVGPTWGDRSEQRVVPEIFNLWRAYLRAVATPPDSSRGSLAVQPGQYWSAAERRRWPTFDLAGSMAYQMLFAGYTPTVLDIVPSHPGSTDEYVVKTLFAPTAGDSGARRDVKPLALMRVYVVREQGHWVLSGALPRLTRDWPRVRVGFITYVCAPSHRFDRARATHALRFADSLAAAFRVPKLTELTYYVTDTPEDAYRIMGLDWAVAAGSKAFPANKMLFAANPAVGEAYLHELAHMVLAPLTTPHTHSLAVEGVATWAGGTLGMDYPATMQKYAAFLRANPTLTLDSALLSNEHDLGLRPAGAVLFQLAYEHGGIDAVKTLLTARDSDDELRRALRQATGLTWTAMADAWRAKVRSYAR